MNDGETFTPIQSGKYSFVVKRNIQRYNGTIINHTYMIGGDYTKCVNISYKYKNNKVVEAYIPHLLYEPECAIHSTLERGDGVVQMIKAIIQHAYKEVPSITLFKFDDMSKIDCVPKDLSKPPERKVIKPVNLAYFSIIYNGKTWYELRFNAEMIDKDKYNTYRERLLFLTDPSQKPPFERFLEIAQPPLEQVDMLKLLYDSDDATTYREFFNGIPKNKRCDILYSWLTTFMKYYIGDVYNETNWVIDVETMNRPSVGSGGGYTRKNSAKRRSPKKYRLYTYKDIQSL